MAERREVDYPHLLRASETPANVGIFGILLGLLIFLFSMPLVARGLAAVGWLVAGRPGEASEYVAWLLRYEHPWGIISGHMGLAVLIPISLGLVAFVHHESPGKLWSVEGRPRWGFGAASLLAAALIVGSLLVVQIRTSDHEFVWSPQENWQMFLLAVLITSPIQAVAEEVFFRGYLMQAFGAMVESPWFGIVASAAVFAILHAGQNLPLFAVRLAFGLVAGWLVWRTGGLEAGIAAHVVNNILAFTLAAFTGSIAEIKATTEIGWSDAVWDLARFGIFAGVAVWLAWRMRISRTAAASV